MSMQSFYKQLQAAPKAEQPFSIFAQLTQATLEQVKTYKALQVSWTQW